MKVVIIIFAFLGLLFSFTSADCSYDLTGVAAITSDCPNYDSTCCCPSAGSAITIKSTGNGLIQLITDLPWSPACKNVYAINSKMISLPWNSTANDFDFTKNITFNGLEWKITSEAVSNTVAHTPYTPYGNTSIKAAAILTSQNGSNCQWVWIYGSKQEESTLAVELLTQEFFQEF